LQDTKDKHAHQIELCKNSVTKPNQVKIREREKKEEKTVATG
jgi:hypothetical protein